MTMLRPSTYPSSRSPCRKASRRGSDEEAPDRMPIRGTFAGCCASANATVARKKKLISHETLIFRAFSCTAMDMPQKRAFEKLYFFRGDKGRPASHSCYKEYQI